MVRSRVGHPREQVGGWDSPGGEQRGPSVGWMLKVAVGITPNDASMRVERKTEGEGVG